MTPAPPAPPSPWDSRRSPLSLTSSNPCDSSVPAASSSSVPNRKRHLASLCVLQRLGTVQTAFRVIVSEHYHSRRQAFFQVSGRDFPRISVYLSPAKRWVHRPLSRSLNCVDGMLQLVGVSDTCCPCLQSRFQTKPRSGSARSHAAR